MKKVVIIGGGAAGLSLAIGLKEIGFEVKIFEKRKANHHNGLALLLLPNGFNVLQKMGLENEILKKIHPIHYFEHQYSNGKLIQSESMHHLFGAKRHDIVEVLQNKISPDDIIYEHEFSHFDFDENENATAVYFTNGHVEKADIFIGADGAHSKIRKLLFPQSQLSKINIKEIVSLIKAPELVKQLNGKFTKTTCKAGGRAVGVLPCSEEDIVWFMQFDETMIDFDPAESNMRSFMVHQLGSWASPVKELLIKTDFSNSYLWNTHDMDSLPKYHKNNIALVGDAAHMFTTFTSQGLNNALEDGYTLSNLFGEFPLETSTSKIFDAYFQARSEAAEKHLAMGRELKNEFLDIQSHQENRMVPIAV